MSIWTGQLSDNPSGRSLSCGSSGKTLTPERWRQIRGIFDRVIEQSTAARMQILDRECGADAALREEVETLIRSYQDSGTFLDEPAVRLEPLGIPGAELPERIGVYRILRRIGQGGMGEVLLARRDDGVYRQEVAVKLLKAGLASPSMVRRFRSERQILANLRHPAIAQLIDGGTTPARQPYLVMEHVDGTPIDVYCDRERLSIEARLLLFRKVCEAVHFAHQNLVIHRDIKPSNLLVTAAGEPKLLDFGIAKLLRPGDFPEAVDATETGMLALTPEYASPEQLQGAVVTTASDVYSLGVLLYIVLTGRRPYELDRSKTLEVMRKVCAEMPPKPSARVAPRSAGEPADDERAASMESISSARRSDPRGLRRLLAGDLDTIVLRALAKDPQRRYTSAEQLGQDLDRYLGGLPVLARRDTFGYRVGKFVRRHRVAVAATVAAFGALVTFLVVLLFQRDEIAAQRDRSQELSQFLLDVFAIPDPTRARGEKVTARELLEQAAGDIERQLATEPEVRADLLMTMGRTFGNLGLSEEAGRLLETALELHQEAHGRTHPAVATDLHELGRVRVARGDYEAGRALLEQALAIRRRLHGDEHPEVVESLIHLARAGDLVGDLDEAESLHRQALDLARRLGQPELIAQVLDRFGILLMERAQLDAAETMMREALDLYDGLYGELHPEAALSRNNLATLYGARGDYESAERIYRETERIQRRLYEGPHAHLAMTLNNLALVLSKQGRFDEAEALFEQALAMRTEVYGEEHPLRTATRKSIADLLHARGDIDKAEELIDEVLAEQRRLLGDEHADVAASLDRLAQILVDKGRFEAAEGKYREALAISRKLFGEHHPDVGTRLNNLADLAFQRRRVDEAEDLYGEALEIHREVYGDAHPAVASILYNLASLTRAQGDLEAADTRFETAVDAGVAALGEDHLKVALARTSWAELKIALGDDSEAETLAARALPVLERGLAPDHAWTVAARGYLGVALRRQGRYAEAEPHLLACLEHHRQRSGPDAPATAALRRSVIGLYEDWGKPDQAARYRALQSAGTPGK
jgi:serine/threonine-protein kinase